MSGGTASQEPYDEPIFLTRTGGGWIWQEASHDLLAFVPTQAELVELIEATLSRT
jgi:hypothetical protein